MGECVKRKLRYKSTNDVCVCVCVCVCVSLRVHESSCKTLRVEGNRTEYAPTRFARHVSSSRGADIPRCPLEIIRFRGVPVLKTIYDEKTQTPKKL